MDQLSCLLLTKLPRELRDRIYIDSLVEAEDINIESLEHNLPNLNHSEREEFPEPPLLRTSTQLRHEALPIYYSRNTFRAIVFDEDSTPPLRWLQSLSPLARKSIKDLVIQYQISPAIREHILTQDDYAGHGNVGSDDAERDSTIQAALRVILGYRDCCVRRCGKLIDGVGGLKGLRLESGVLRFEIAREEGDEESRQLEMRRKSWKKDMEERMRLLSGKREAGRSVKV